MKPRLEEFMKPKITYKDIAQVYGCGRTFLYHVAAGRKPAPARLKLLCSKMLGLPVSIIFPIEKNGADKLK